MTVLKRKWKKGWENKNVKKGDMLGKGEGFLKKAVTFELWYAKTDNKYMKDYDQNRKSSYLYIGMWKI